MNYLSLIDPLSRTPLPTILVVAGIVFWILAIAGSVAGKVTIQQGNQKIAGAIGTVFIALGLILSYVAVPLSNETDSDATMKTARTKQAPPPITPPITTTTIATETQATSAPIQPQQIERPSPKAQPQSRLPQEANVDEQSGGPPGPGVNCSGTPDEVEICNNPTLRDLDLKLYGIYQALLQKYDKSQQVKLKHDEVIWWKQRMQCRTDDRCLIDIYKKRIGELQAER